MSTRPTQNSIYSSRTNELFNTVQAFGSIPASFAPLLDLGTDQFSTTLMLYNSTDVEMTVRFAETGSELKVPAGIGPVLYPFPHNGVLEYKYSSAVPGSGYFYIVSW